MERTPPSPPPDYRRLPPRIRPEDMAECRPVDPAPPPEPDAPLITVTRLMLLYS